MERAIFLPPVTLQYGSAVWITASLLSLAVGNVTPCPSCQLATITAGCPRNTCGRVAVHAMQRRWCRHAVRVQSRAACTGQLSAHRIDRRFAAQTAAVTHMLLLQLEETAPTCRFCRYFNGWTASDTCAVCSHPGCSRVRTQPALGGCRFEREIGAEDRL